MTSEWRHGWPLVATVAAVLASGGTLWAFVSSLFIDGITAEFGWTRGELAAISAFAALGALSAPFLGWAADRFGSRIVGTLGTTALAIMYLGLTLAKTKLEFQLLAIGVGAFITASGSLVMARPIIQWFDRSRGLALGVATMGSSLAGIGVPLVVQDLIADYGWRAGYYFLAGAALVICVPLIALFVRERPGPARHIDLADLEGIAPETDPPAPRIHWRQVVVRPVFWFLAIGLLCVNMAGSGLLSQLAVLLKDKGISPEWAAAGISIYAGAIIVGRLGCGWLLDRLPPALVACAFTLVPAMGCAALIPSSVPFVIAAVAVACSGLQQGSETDVLAFFVSRIFGARNFSMVFGMIVTIGIAGTVGGGLMFGLTFDHTGSYDVALLVSVALFLTGAGCFLSVGRVPTSNGSVR